MTLNTETLCGNEYLCSGDVAGQCLPCGLHCLTVALSKILALFKICLTFQAVCVILRPTCPRESNDEKLKMTMNSIKGQTSNIDWIAFMGTLRYRGAVALRQVAITEDVACILMQWKSLLQCHCRDGDAVDEKWSPILMQSSQFIRKWLILHISGQSSLHWTSFLWATFSCEFMRPTIRLLFSLGGGAFIPHPELQRTDDLETCCSELCKIIWIIGLSS